MKAAVINGPGDIRLIEKPVPRPGPGEVLVRVEYCGICGSDLHAYKSGFFPSEVVIGHEFSGIIVEAGPGEVNLTGGERVTGNNNTPCGSCCLCLTGSDNLCPEMRRLGIADHGALAEYVAVPAESIYCLPETTPLDEAALAEPLSVALHAAKRSQCSPGQEVVIIGAGTIGLILLALLKQRGIEKIAVIEPLSNRADVAFKMGATAVINPQKDYISSAIASFCGKQGPAFVFECAGLPETINEALSLAAANGTVFILGICHQPVEINFLSLVTREINIVPAFSKTRADFQEAVELISAGKIKISPLISQIISLQELETGFTAPADEYIKILVRPEASQDKLQNGKG